MSTPIIEAKNLVKTYYLGDNVIHAVNDVSLTINKGDFVAIVGKSGSGKSTLMHMLGLLDSPTSGSIKVNGVEVSKMDENELASLRNEAIGFVFQSFNLLARTSAFDNVLLPLRYSKTPREKWNARVTETLKDVELSDRMQNKSNELSGGQKQRVAIARALVTKPSIIFADEPTGNLDSKTGEEIVELFNQLNEQGKTIVIVTHDEDFAQIAEKVFTIKDGKLQ